MVILGLGSGRAVAWRNGLCLSGPLVWRWKDWIDRRWMRMYTEMRMKLDPSVLMRCGGCGAKVGAEVLTGALADLPRSENNDLVVGLATPDEEAAIDVFNERLQAEGHWVFAGGLGMPATVIDQVTPSMKLFRDESFGPVVAVIRARDEAHAIALANDTEYGLTAAVYGRDIARAFEVAKKIDSGMCHINGPTVHDEGQMPFGGVKASGYGRFGGKAAINEFTELRWITIQTKPRHYPF